MGLHNRRVFWMHIHPCEKADRQHKVVVQPQSIIHWFSTQVRIPSITRRTSMKRGHFLDSTILNYLMQTFICTYYCFSRLIWPDSKRATRRCSCIMSVCPGLIFFCIFIFYVLTVFLLKGMGESFLLFKDEPISPNIDEVMALWIIRNMTQNTKIGQENGENRTPQI